MDRRVLTDAASERMAPLIVGRPDQKDSTGRDNRMFVEGVLWIVRTGSPWRDLPEAFGGRNSAFRRFSRRSVKCVCSMFYRSFPKRSLSASFDIVFRSSSSKHWSRAPRRGSCLTLQQNACTLSYLHLLANPRAAFASRWKNNFRAAQEKLRSGRQENATRRAGIPATMYRRRIRGGLG